MIQFVDPYELDPDLPEPGRQWRAAELRLKSNEDLQKLWVVLIKERNMLHTTKMLHKKQKSQMPHRRRVLDVRKSMGLIKRVLHERQREKDVRDQRLSFEYRRSRALTNLDFGLSEVWPPYIPGEDRMLALAQSHTFQVICRTADGEPPDVRPEAEHLDFTVHIDGEQLSDDLIDKHVVRRPPTPSRPDEMAYACHLTLRGDTVHRSRFLESSTKLSDEPVVAAEVGATLYGHQLGSGTVPVLLLPSKRLRRRVKMADINATMSQALTEAREQAAREAGVELPPPSPSPEPTEYWKPRDQYPLM